MLKRLAFVLAAAAVIAFAAAPAFAQKGNGAPNGAHYNLNIIGVEKAKTQDLTGSERHTIFVALGKNSTVTSKIYLTPAADFGVCDGNAFDPAYNCAGAQIAPQGAVFELPCNTNLTAGTDPDGEPSTLIACESEDPQLSYQVWLRGLGGKGSATMQTCATEVGDQDGDGVPNETYCSTENVVIIRDPSTLGGKQVFKNVTQELTSLNVCYDVNPDPTITDIDCFRYALFTDQFEDWYWSYANSGLRLAQLRFYEY